MIRFLPISAGLRKFNLLPRTDSSLMTSSVANALTSSTAVRKSGLRCWLPSSAMYLMNLPQPFAPPTILPRAPSFTRVRGIGILGSSVALAAFATMGAGAPVGSAGKGGSGDETTVAASERARSPGSEQGNGGYEHV
jgi:hypothetical protein